MENVLKNFDIVNILEGQKVPKGTKFYTSMLGDMYFVDVTESLDGAVRIALSYREDAVTTDLFLDRTGHYTSGGECVLFPSREMRDWSQYSYETTEKSLEEIRKEYVEEVMRCGLSTYKEFPDKLQCIIDMLAVARYVNGDDPSEEDGLITICYDIDHGEVKCLDSDIITGIVYFKTLEAAEKAVSILGEDTIKIAFGNISL